MAWVAGLLAVASQAFAGITYVPAQNEFGAYAFEDMYPYEGDLDFNDAVVRYHVEVVDDGGATPVTTSFAMALQVQAIGATRCMGVALRIPAPIGSVAEIGRRNGSATSSDGAPWSDPAVLLQGVDYTPDPEGTTVWIADDLRSLCGGATEFVNTDPALPITACERVEFTARFASDPGFDAGDAPFDLFLHECGNRVAQIHLPGFGPTIEGQADPALGTGDSDPLDPYVHRGRPGSGALQGLPWALHIAADPGGHPQERAAITQAWPSIADFAASGGASGTQFWADGEVDPGFVYTEGALGAPLPSPARGPVRDGRDPTHAALDCGDVDVHRADVFNADYWVRVGGEIDGTPELATCLYDRHLVEFETPTAGTEWAIPEGVGYATVKAWGAGGAGGSNGINHSQGGGSGGFAEALVAVDDLVSLHVVVGGGGQGPSGSWDGNAWGPPPAGNGSFTTPAIGGGGPGAPGCLGHWGRAGGGGGGGYSGVFSAAPGPGSAIAIAGGGGGAGIADGGDTPAPGGPGGGATGGTPATCRGGSAWTGGGGSTTGGVAGNASSGSTASGWSRNGGPLLGGSGVVVANMAMHNPGGGYYGRGGGGGGGGGWYGGAGGGTSSTTTNGCGGGGGSGYVNSDPARVLDGSLAGASANPCNTSSCVPGAPGGLSDPDWKEGFARGGMGGASPGRVVIRY